MKKGVEGMRGYVHRIHRQASIYLFVLELFTKMATVKSHKYSRMVRWCFRSFQSVLSPLKLQWWDSRVVLNALSRM